MATQTTPTQRGEQLTMRIDATLKARLLEIAEADGRTLSNFVHRILEEAAA